MDFLIQKTCGRTAQLNMNYCYKKYDSSTSKRLWLELYDEKTETHLYVLGNISSF